MMRLHFLAANAADSNDVSFESSHEAAHEILRVYCSNLNGCDSNGFIVYAGETNITYISSNFVGTLNKGREPDR